MSSDAGPTGPLPRPTGLSTTDLAVLAVLHDAADRVVSRRELARRAGIADRHERRCDVALVNLRRVLGAEAIVTVRSRGWRLHPELAERAAAILAEHMPATPVD